MTLKDFEQISSMKKEIDVLDKRLAKAEGGAFVGDYAKDYSTGYERIITIQGYTMRNADKVNAILGLLETRKRELEERVLAAEQFIASLGDSRMRTLLTLRFMEGKTWRQIATRVYGVPTEDRARKCVMRFFGRSF